jgi:hypothetical protein
LRSQEKINARIIFMSPDNVTEIKVKRLEWLGHVIRMEDTRLPKMIFNAKPEGWH